MTLVLAPPPAWVTIALDTTGPALTVLPHPGVVQPPDALLVIATSDEPLADASATLVDALGVEHPVGAQWWPDGLLSVLLPTVGLPTGRSTLRLLARDPSGNVSETDLAVLIDRPRPFDLQAATMGSFGTRARSATPLDLQADPLPALSLRSEARRG